MRYAALCGAAVRSVLPACVHAPQAFWMPSCAPGAETVMQKPDTETRCPASGPHAHGGATMQCAMFCPTFDMIRARDACSPLMQWGL